MKKQIPPSFVYLLSIALWLLAARPASAQSAPFVYQGRLTKASTPANDKFDMQFKLFDTADVGTGTQQGDTKTNPTVPVANGVFTVPLDFGAAVFDGSPRYLEIGVRPAGNASPYNMLAPRQQITSIPYAIHSLSATQLDGHPSTSFVQADNNGNVGIGAPAPATDVKLLVNGNARITTGGSGGYVQIGTPAGETGLSVLGKNRFDLRFDDNTLKLAAGLGLGFPSSHNGISMNTDGNVGIGMESPLLPSQWKLEIKGGTRIDSGGSGGAVQFSAPNEESGMSIVGANRADVRFDGNRLTLTAGFGSGAPPAANGIAITTSGNVGIGTITPAHRLSLIGGPSWTANLWSGALELSDASAIGWQANQGGQRFGIGQSTGGLYFFRSDSDPGTTGSPAKYDLNITDKGHVTQPADKGGLVKAMAYIAGDGTVIRCYNSHPPQNAPATSTVPCGIRCDVIPELDKGATYVVHFGFSVQDRFVMVTARTAGTARYQHKSAAFNYGGTADSIFVRIWSPDDGDNELALDEFMIFVF